MNVYDILLTGIGITIVLGLLVHPVAVTVGALLVSFALFGAPPTESNPEAVAPPTSGTHHLHDDAA